MIIQYLAEKTGKEVPVNVEIRRIDPYELHKYLVKNIETRNGMCNHGKHNCAKYGQRPCCPPSLKTFDKFPQKQYMYLLKVTLSLEDYFVYSPETAKSFSNKFLFMSASHAITKNIVNRTVGSLSGQGFRVGGCSGCTFSRDGKCKQFMPPLEGTGLILDNVVAEFFDEPIEWAKKKKGISYMTALGGLMTNENVSKAEWRKALMIACNHK